MNGSSVEGVKSDGLPAENEFVITLSADEQKRVKRSGYVDREMHIIYRRSS